jgi:hypothetical protein
VVSGRGARRLRRVLVHGRARLHRRHREQQTRVPRSCGNQGSHSNNTKTVNCVLRGNKTQRLGQTTSG